MPWGPTTLQTFRETTTTLSSTDPTALYIDNYSRDVEASGNTVVSFGPVTDHGADNTVSRLGQLRSTER